MGRKTNRMWNTLGTVLVGLAVLLAAALSGVRLFGLRPYVVLSGSMEPVYHVGSLLYVKAVDYRELSVGDPITYMINQDTVVTHRITEVLPDEENPEVIRYITKGDANDSADGSSVHYKNVIGKPVFSIPYMGYLANFIQRPPGSYVAVAFGALLILLVFLPDVFSDEKKEKTRAR